MSNYTVTTNFAAKDLLTSGNPLKVVLGAQLTTEFNNIATAIGTKFDSTTQSPVIATPVAGQLALSVTGALNAPISIALANTSTGAAAAADYAVTNGTDSAVFSIQGTGATSAITNGAAGSVASVGTTTAAPLQIITNSTLRATITALGNWALSAPDAGSTLPTLVAVQGGNNPTIQVGLSSTASAPSYLLAIQGAFDITHNLTNGGVGQIVVAGTGSTFGMGVGGHSNDITIAANHVVTFGTPGSTGWGTPTGGAIITNFPSATATLNQTAEMVAALVSALKTVGILGA